MKACSLANRHTATMGPAIIEYVEHIVATLQPFGGRHIVHGGGVEVREGSWSGDLIIIEFPDRYGARSWYESAVYQEIMGLCSASHLRLHPTHPYWNGQFAAGVSVRSRPA